MHPTKPLSIIQKFNEIKQLEDSLQSDQQNNRVRERLLDYYSFLFRPSLIEHVFLWLTRKERHLLQRDERLLLHVTWVIENCPSSLLSKKLCYNILEVRHPVGYQKCKAMWLTLLEHHPGDPTLLFNAARFLTCADQSKAEDLMVRALSIQPNNNEVQEALEFLRALKSKDKAQMLRHRIHWLNWHSQHEQDHVSPSLAKHREDQLTQWQQELDAINSETT